MNLVDKPAPRLDVDLSQIFIYIPLQLIGRSKPNPKELDCLPLWVLSEGQPPTNVLRQGMPVATGSMCQIPLGPSPARSLDVPVKLPYQPYQRYLS